jgi:hypothetical protein
MKYPTLADVYAAVLKGEVDIEKTFMVSDGGSVIIQEDGTQVYDGSDGDILEFVSDILGITVEEI